MTDEDIELAVDWAGENGCFVEAMLAVQFLDGDPGLRRIHDWAEHNPWAAGADARSERARWAALCKQYGRRDAARFMPEYAARLLDAVPDGANGTLPAVPESATGTQPAESGSAPSPSPLPSPSPIEQKQSAAADSSTAAGDAVAGDADATEDEDEGNVSDDLLGDQQQGKPRRKTVPPCPHDEIITLYHEKLPTLRAVQSWTSTRRSNLQARWREAPERQTLDWWGGFFDYVARSDFLMGRKNGFRADLGWLLKPEHFANTIEHKYHDEGRP